MACIFDLMDGTFPYTQILVGFLHTNLDATVRTYLRGENSAYTVYQVMKKKVGFNLRSICGEHVIVAEGKENIDFSKIISMNETSAYLWEAIEGKEFTAETLADLLLEQYEVEYNIAYKDCLELIVKWEEAGIIEP